MRLAFSPALMLGLCVSSASVSTPPRISGGRAPIDLARGDTITPAPGFGVTIRPSVVSVAGDTIAFEYVVAVIPTAHDSLVSFMVDAPGVISVQMPGSWPEWRVGSRWQALSVADWGKDTLLIAPRDSTPPLRFRARGLLDVVRYWAQVNEPDDPRIIVTPVDSSTTRDTSVTMKAATGLTVGVGAMPADISPNALVTRLSSLIGRVCALGWIDNGGICNSLKVKVKPDANTLHALLNELSAQRGKHVSEAAYLLISQNVTFLLTSL